MSSRYWFRIILLLRSSPAPSALSGRPGCSPAASGSSLSSPEAGGRRRLDSRCCSCWGTAPLREVDGSERRPRSAPELCEEEKSPLPLDSDIAGRRPGPPQAAAEEAREAAAPGRRRPGSPAPPKAPRARRRRYRLRRWPERAKPAGRGRGAGGAKAATSRSAAGAVAVAAP